VLVAVVSGVVANLRQPVEGVIVKDQLAIFVEVSS